MPPKMSSLNDLYHSTLSNLSFNFSQSFKSPISPTHNSYPSNTTTTSNNHNTATSLPLSTHNTLTNVDLQSSADAMFDSDSEDEYYSEYEPLSNYSFPRVMKTNDVVIAVQASTISSLEMKVRKESLIENVTLDISSGHAVVGVVRETGRDAETQGIHVGDRVASIVKSIVPNPRYATVPIERVAKVPFGVDSAQAACAAYTYMIAFQSLNHGKVAKDRYSFSSLENKIVLIMDGVSVIGQALIEMAYTAGAFQVYAVGNSSQHAYISSLKAQPLFPNTETWPLSVIEGVDVVIDLKAEEKGSLLNHSAARMALKKNGKLVCIGSAAPGSMQIMSIYEELQALIRLCLVDEAEATYYDLFSTIDHYPEKIKSDLKYILSLLAKQRINPKIAKYVSSDEVEYGLATMKPGIITGSIILEPWKRKGPPKQEEMYTQQRISFRDYH